MRRADRLFELLQILRRSRGPVTAAAMATELEVSVRCIYRDIAALMAQRVPITGEPGIGYVLRPGFDLPPLMLTDDELDAMMLGMAWVTSRGEPEIARAAQNLIAKIEAVIPPRLRPHLTDPSISVAPTAAVEEPVSAALLRSAIRNGQKLHISYVDGTGQETQRKIWPILLGYRDQGRILAAWCEARGAFRFFRSDRMRDALVLNERVPERMPLLRTRWQIAMAEESKRYGREATRSSEA